LAKQKYGPAVRSYLLHPSSLVHNIAVHFTNLGKLCKNAEPNRHVTHGTSVGAGSPKAMNLPKHAVLNSHQGGKRI